MMEISTLLADPEAIRLEKIVPNKSSLTLVVRALGQAATAVKYNERSVPRARPIKTWGYQARSMYVRCVGGVRQSGDSGPGACGRRRRVSRVPAIRVRLCRGVAGSLTVLPATPRRSGAADYLAARFFSTAARRSSQVVEGPWTAATRRTSRPLLVTQSKKWRVVSLTVEGR